MKKSPRMEALLGLAALSRDTDLARMASIKARMVTGEAEVQKLRALLSDLGKHGLEMPPKQVSHRRTWIEQRIREELSGLADLRVQSEVVMAQTRKSFGRCTVLADIHRRASRAKNS